MPRYLPAVIEVFIVKKNKDYKIDFFGWFVWFFCLIFHLFFVVVGKM